MLKVIIIMSCDILINLIVVSLVVSRFENSLQNRKKNSKATKLFHYGHNALLGSLHD